MILLFIDDNMIWKFMMFVMTIMMMIVVIMIIICYDVDNNDDKICSVSYGNNSISYNDNDNNNKYNILINGDEGCDDETDQW